MDSLFFCFSIPCNLLAFPHAQGLDKERLKGVPHYIYPTLLNEDTHSFIPSLFLPSLYSLLLVGIFEREVNKRIQIKEVLSLFACK